MHASVRLSLSVCVCVCVFVSLCVSVFYVLYVYQRASLFKHPRQRLGEHHTIEEGTRMTRVFTRITAFVNKTDVAPCLVVRCSGDYR